MEYIWGVLPYDATIVCILCNQSLSVNQGRYFEDEEDKLLFCFNHKDTKAEFWEDEVGYFQYRLYKNAAIRKYEDGDG